jgi:hypothetical protein
VTLTVREQRIPPVRGLAFTVNAKGRSLDLTVVRRWIRLNREAFRAEKIDVLDPGIVSPLWPDLLACAADVGVRLSLRTDCAEPPGDLTLLRAAGLLDVFLCPHAADAKWLDAWIEACGRADLPIRLQLQVPFGAELDACALAGRGLTAVNIALDDPFTSRSGCRDKASSETACRQMNALAAAFRANEIEVNLVGLPFCLADEDNLPHVLNSAQYYLDHQQYIRRSHELAASLYRRGPVSTRIALIMVQSRYTLHKDPIDARLLPWLVHRSWLYARTMALHKLTRYLRIARFAATPVEDPLKPIPEHGHEAPNPVCASSCTLVRICDRDTAAFRRVLPGLEVSARGGDAVVSPMHFAARQPKHYDAIDVDRLVLSDGHAALARKANDIVRNRPADRRIGPFEYGTDDGLFAQFEGAVEWRSVTNSEKVSWSLATLEPPCTVSVTWGGGVAEFIGFSFGRHCKIVCPMEATRHVLTLHVDGDGHYVLLRDGVPVRPVEFEGGPHVPLRLGNRLDLRLSVWNIDKTVFSQFVDIWQGGGIETRGQSKAKYSIVIVNTRYARRLQASLRCLAHQRDIDLNQIEAIVCYVPGLDATDDVIDSCRYAYPDLRILRSPFAEQYVRSKGFIINESRRLVSGDWIILLDADTLLPPDFFARVDAVEAGCKFIAPDGRKLLTPETTGRILMGEIEPWNQWDELLRGPGELRLRESHGVPIGFCQCVRAECMNTVSYQELDHFEGADMQFGLQMLKHFGKEKRIVGAPVLHLDHGGSQWYGTTKHF